MATQEIRQDEWGTFLDAFSKLHDSQPASMQIEGAGTGSHQEARDLPFAGASFETKGSDSGSIILMLGTDKDDHLTHTVVDAAQIWHDSGDDTGQEVLEIRSGDGQNVLIRFGHARRQP